MRVASSHPAGRAPDAIRYWRLPCVAHSVAHRAGRDDACGRALCGLLSIAESELHHEDVRGAEEEAEVERLVKEWSPELDLADLDQPSEAEVEFPRYQIQVRLVDADSVPR